MAPPPPGNEDWFRDKFTDLDIDIWPQVNARSSHNRPRVLYFPGIKYWQIYNAGTISILRESKYGCGHGLSLDGRQLHQSW